MLSYRCDRCGFFHATTPPERKPYDPAAALQALRDIDRRRLGGVAA